MKRTLLVYWMLWSLVLSVKIKAEYRLVGNSFCGGYSLHTNSAITMSAGFHFYAQQNVSRNSKTGLAEAQHAPLDYSLVQNYPNPFNAATTIEFSLPTSCRACLKIYSLLGNEVAVLFNEQLPAGNHKKSWNAVKLANGAYYFVLETPAFRQSRAAILLK